MNSRSYHQLVRDVARELADAQQEPETNGRIAQLLKKLLPR